MLRQLVQARTAFVAAYTELMQEADAKVFDAPWRLEAALKDTSFTRRLNDAIKAD